MADEWRIDRIVFTRHALNQMFARAISVDDVKAVVFLHDVLAEYPEDTPYPSRLLLGIVNRRKIHLVLGYNAKESTAYVITVYEPDPALWEPDFRRRKNL